MFFTDSCALLKQGHGGDGLAGYISSLTSTATRGTFLVFFFASASVSSSFYRLGSDSFSFSLREFLAGGKFESG